MEREAIKGNIYKIAKGEYKITVIIANTENTKKWWAEAKKNDTILATISGDAIGSENMVLAFALSYLLVTINQREINIIDETQRKDLQIAREVVMASLGEKLI